MKRRVVTFTAVMSRADLNFLSDARTFLIGMKTHRGIASRLNRILAHLQFDAQLLAEPTREHTARRKGAGK